MEEYTLKQAQQKVDDWIKTYGVKYFEPLTNLGILMEETGELARVMVRQFGEQSYKEADLEKSLEDEMADVLWVLLCLANQCKVDLNKAFFNNLDKKTNRDEFRHRNNPKLT